MKDRLSRPHAESARSLLVPILAMYAFALALSGCVVSEAAATRTYIETPAYSTSAPTRENPFLTPAPVMADSLNDNPPKPTETPSPTQKPTPTSTATPKIESTKAPESAPKPEIKQEKIKNLFVVGSSTYNNMEKDGFEKVFSLAEKVDGRTHPGATLKILTEDIRNITMPEADRDKVTFLFLMGGINDIVNQGMTAKEAFKLVPDFIAAAKEMFPNAVIYFQGHTPNNMGKEQQQDEFDRLLEEFQEKFGYTYIPIPKDLFTKADLVDSLHMGALARAKLGKYLVEYALAHPGKRISLLTKTPEWKIWLVSHTADYSPQPFADLCLQPANTRLSLLPLAV